MSGFKNTGKTCGKSKREKNSKFKLPLSARDIDKVQYFNNTFMNALKFHFFSHDLTVPYPVSRKVLYDIWYDALKNSNDKIHKKNIELEYAKFLEYFNEKLPQYHEYIRDWEAYRRSELYHETLKTLNEVKRTDHRLQIATDFALSYLYSKYQTRHNYETAIIKVEQALHLDVIPKLWSKTSFWLAMQLLVFDPANLYANTIANNKVYASEFDREKEEALKIYITPWYERDDIKLSQEWRNLALVYHELIVPLAGEVGSVGLAEAARKGTVISLIHLANGLATLASLHPAMRTVSTASKILEFAATFLDKSILAWLGWQIGVEWALDGAIQKVLTEFGKFLYTAITGEPIKKGYYTDNELKEISEAVQLYLNLLNGKGYIDGSDVKLAEWYNNASPKLRFLLDKIINTINIKEAMYNQLKEARLTLFEKKELSEKGFAYVCNPDANNFVKTINEAIRLYYEKIDYFQKYLSLSGIAKDYLSNLKDVFSDISTKFLDIPLLSIYEEFNNKDSFDYGDYKTDCYAWEYYEDIPRGYVSVGAGYDINCFRVLTGEKVLRISVYYFAMVVDPLPAGMFLASDLNIEIRSYSNFDIENDFYKYLTDCDKIQNINKTLSQIDPNIYLNRNSYKPENFTEYIISNKLKLRKTKKCISVIRKKNKIRIKKFPQEELINFPLMYRKNQIRVELTFGLYDVLPPKKTIISFGESYLTTSKFETVLSQETPDLYKYYIVALSQAYKTNNVGLSPDGTSWCPYVIPDPKKYIKLSDDSFDYTFKIHPVDGETKINRKKSKRSKVICIKA
jgi:hypothetical protein